MSVSADAHLLRAPLSIIVRSVDLMSTAEAAGVAVASLFAGDRQKVAWAWASMWQRAEAGRASAGVMLADQRGDEDDESSARLLRLKGQASDRRDGRDKGRGRAGTKPLGLAGVAPVVVRILKEVRDLEPDDGSIVHAGLSKPGVIFPSAALLTRPEPATDGAADTTAGTGAEKIDDSRDGQAPAGGLPIAGHRRRAVLPPVGEREQMAFDAVQAALALNPARIADLRAQRGIGADAMDDLRQLYEIKMFSGELANEVTLTRTEAEAAQDPDFFLALVAGLEEGDVPLSVRFIFNPLRRLSLRITGDVTVSGLREVEALEYRFRKP